MLAVLKTLLWTLASVVALGALVYGYDRLNAWIVAAEQEEDLS